ncbi:hypothetical protein F7725_000795 [Dissostichus mawsoni]|uniref:Uncharacterized protein n=1 Tax=Dissostichus mawsoni TaxID=36200 RepID=A0A7J5ZFY3_DISMA|nr:hypothetical protein F7725_000795 [Dissostichus mawsoni]
MASTSSLQASLTPSSCLQTTFNVGPCPAPPGSSPCALQPGQTSVPLSLGLRLASLAQTPCPDGRVFIWTCDDPAGNTWTAKLLHKFNDVVWHVSWSITGNILAVSGGDNKVKATGTGPCQVKLIYKA